MKTKFRINDLAAKPLDVELEHPTVGKTGIFIKIVGPHSTAMKTALKAYFAKAEADRTEADELTLFTSCLTGWDEEAFEAPFNAENVHAFFSQPENTWVTEQVVPKLKDSKAFFRAEGGEAS